MTWDVVVVGAGPGGSVAAYEAARTGASVLLLDRCAFPRWKVCGACVSPGALAVLRDLGLGERLVGRALRSLVLRAGGRAVRLPLEGSLALSRSALDSALVGAAEERGVTFWSGARASLAGLDDGVRRIAVRRRGRTFQVTARVLIDATGLGRHLVTSVDRRGGVVPGSRVGVGATFDLPAYPAEPGELQMVVGETGYVGLVRVEDGRLNIAAALDSETLRSRGAASAVDGILLGADLPSLGAVPVLGWRGTPCLTRSPSRVGGERLLRLGDAAGYVEPFTGEGICWAVSGGRVAGRLAARGARGWRAGLLGQWQSYHENRLRPAQRLCRALALALRSPRLVRYAAHALSVAPGLARPLVHRAARAPESFSPQRA